MFTRLILTALCVFTLGSSAFAASITNRDAEAHTLPLTENGMRSEVLVDPGATVNVCDNGCFVTMPNGDRAALAGDETVAIVNGAAVIE